MKQLILLCYILLFTNFAFSQWLSPGTDTYNDPLTDKVGIGLNNPNNVFQVKDYIEFHPTNFGLFLGYQAGTNNTGNYNTFLGYQTGLSNTSGKQNVFIGYLAGNANTTGSNNIFIGESAGISNTTGLSNSFVGRKAGESNTGGSANSFFGKECGRFNATGTNNTAFGTQALKASTTGSYNTAFGNNSLVNSANADSNAVFGMGVLVGAHTYKRNVVIGAYAGNQSQPMSGCVILGSETGYTNSTSNRLMIDNSQTNTPLLDGDFSTNTLTINSILGLSVGTTVNEFSIDGTFADNSDDALVTEKAIKTYVDNAVTNHQSSVTIGDGSAGVDYTLTFNGEDNDGVITWQEDEDNFDLSCTLSLNSGTTINSFLDEDNFASNSETALATQQSIKAYVDAQVSAGGAFLDLTDTPVGFTSANALYTTNGTTDAVLETSVILTEAANTFNLTKGTAVFDLGAGSTLNVDANLTVESASVINQDLTSDASPTFIGLTITNAINEISVDGTLADDSDNAIVTEKAIKAYVDNTVSGSSSWSRSGINIFQATLTDYVGIGLNNPNNVFQVLDYIEFHPTNLGLFLGYQAGTNNTGNYNTFLGYQAGLSNTTGKQNIFIGYLAGNANTTGANNVFIGESAGFSNTSGLSNSFVGRKAGENNTDGDANSFFGKECGRYNTTGTNNTAFGTQSLKNSSTGSYNTVFGNNSLVNTTDADSNAVFGMGALVGIHTYKRNVVIGAYAGNQSQPMSGCVLIGNEAGYNNGVSNRLMIDNSNTNTPLIDGDFTNNVLSINDVLKLTPRDTAPSSPVAGMIYFDSADGKLKVYDGAAWQACY